MPRLQRLPAFNPGTRPLVVISPHPDDETLAVGGFLALQRELRLPVKLIAVTDGGNAYAENVGLADRRVAEQTDAARCLGIASDDIIRLAHTDSGLVNERGALVDSLMSQCSPRSHLLAPWPGDFHPDHEVCGDAAMEVAYKLGCKLTFYFFWTWHRGAPELLKELPLRSLALSQAQRLAKADALSMHRSQLHHPSGDPILHPIHLWPARLPFEVFLPA